MTPGGWLIIAFACVILAAIICSWEDRRDDKHARDDFREHLAHPAHPVVGEDER